MGLISCDIDGCDNPPETIIRPSSGHHEYADFIVCSWCAEELTALYGWSWR